MSQNFVWPAPQAAPPVGGATAANQVLEIAELSSINSKLTSPVAVTGPLTDAELRAAAVPVSAASLPLPTGAATEATLASIDGKLTSPLAVTGPLTDAELRAAAVPVSLAASPLPTGAATAANQALEIAELVDIANSVQIIDDTVETHAGNSFIMVGGRHGPGAGAVVELAVDSSGQLQVDVASSALPTGAATAANQTTANASLASIDGKLTSPLAVTGPLTDAELRATPVPVSGTVSTGGLTDAELRATAVPVSLTGTVAVSAASLPLPTGAATETTLAALNAKSAASFVPERFDETVTTYVGATDRINTVVYKLATVTVATLTMSYDGSNRLTGVVKT